MTAINQITQTLSTKWGVEKTNSNYRKTKMAQDLKSKDSMLSFSILLTKLGTMDVMRNTSKHKH